MEPLPTRTYESLPTGPPTLSKSVNGWPVISVVVPALVSALVSLVGLCLWAGGLLGARGTTKALFDDLGVEVSSAETLQRQIALAVGLMIPLCVLGISASVWLEGLGDTAPGRSSLSSADYHSYLTWTTAATALLLLASALGFAGSTAGLVDMQMLKSSTGGGSGPEPPPWWPPAAPAPIPADGLAATAAAPSTAPAAAGSMVSGAPAAPAAVGRGKDTSVRVTAVAAAAGGKGAETPATAPDLAMAWQRNGKGGSGCPPGCIDFGWLGPVLGLPVSCFCNPWLVGKVAERVDKVCVQLSVSVAGGIFMLIGFMGLLMLLSAQSARLQLVGQYPLLYGQKYNTRPGTATAAVAADGGVMVVP